MFDSFKRVEELGRRQLLQCNECRRSTIHTLEAGCTGQWSQDVGHGHSVEGGSDYSIYRCGACDAVCFEQSSWCSEDYDHDDEGHMVLNRTDLQYPPPSSEDFALNTDFTPRDLNELIEEMIYAVAGAQFKLATVALRMVVEFIVNDKGCKGANLKAKIADLHRQGFVNDAQLDLLQTIRDKGNAGAHERKAMSRDEMVAGIGVINLLLEKLYNGPARETAVVTKAERAFKAAQAPKLSGVGVHELDLP